MSLFVMYSSSIVWDKTETDENTSCQKWTKRDSRNNQQEQEEQQEKQARKGFRPISASQIFLGT